MIPALDSKTGYLPDGVYPATWSELVGMFGITPYRRGLVLGLQTGLQGLRSAGCRRALIDGSFISAKDLPGDYDVAYDPRGMNPFRLDPVFFDFSRKRAAMKIKFGGEYFPEHFLAAPGITYREWFSKDKNGVAKGLVQIDPTSVP